MRTPTKPLGRSAGTDIGPKSGSTYGKLHDFNQVVEVKPFLLFIIISTVPVWDVCLLDLSSNRCNASSATIYTAKAEWCCPCLCSEGWKNKHSNTQSLVLVLINGFRVMRRTDRRTEIPWFYRRMTSHSLFTTVALFKTVSTIHHQRGYSRVFIMSNVFNVPCNSAACSAMQPLLVYW